MNNWLFLIPLISSFAGLLLNWTAIYIFFALILPKRLPAIGQKMGKLASAQIFSIADLEKKLAGEESIKKLMPIIEKHIDEFLRNKLSKALPVISMFIGEKTINQLKEVFMKELEVIFPVAIKSYLWNLESEFDIEEIIPSKIAALPPKPLSRKIKESIPKELRQIRLFGALSGFLIGLLQLLFTWAISF